LPKALAGIGRLPDTVADRSIGIRLVRRARGEKVERFRKREAQTWTTPIRNDLEAWSNRAGVKANLREARPELPDELSDRQQDITEPLLAIADMAAGDWPERGRNALVTLCVQIDDDESLGVKLLSGIHSAFNGDDKIATQDLIQALVDQDTDAPWALWWEGDLKNGKVQGAAQRLARLLKPYKIKSRVIRLSDEKEARGYVRADFLEGWNRFLPFSEKKV
jgi:uncharacterized protein DUF3631